MNYAFPFDIEAEITRINRALQVAAPQGGQDIPIAPSHEGPSAGSAVAASDITPEELAEEAALNSKPEPVDEQDDDHGQSFGELYAALVKGPM